MSIKSDSGLLRKLLFSIPLIFSTQFFALEASAEGEAFYQLLKVLKDKGTLSQDEYESLLNASKEISGSKEKAEKTTIAQTKKKKKKKKKSYKSTGTLEFAINTIIWRTDGGWGPGPG